MFATAFLHALQLFLMPSGMSSNAKSRWRQAPVEWDEEVVGGMHHNSNYDGKSSKNILRNGGE